MSDDNLAYRDMHSSRNIQSSSLTSLLSHNINNPYSKLTPSTIELIMLLCFKH